MARCSVALVALLCTGLIGRSAAQCLVGYIDPNDDRVSSSCYRFSTSVDGWQDARSQCVHEGGDLAVLNSDTEMKFVISKYAKMDYHVGLRLADDASSTWAWVDGSPVDSSVKLEFNNKLTFASFASLRNNSKFTMVYGDSREYYICERSKYTQVQCDLAQGWSLANDGSCVKLYDQTRLNFWSARSKCQSANADLVSVTNAEINNLISTKLKENYHSIIGLTTALNSEVMSDGNATWKWVNGESLSYANWDATQQTAISVARRNNTCTLLVYGSKWHVINCSSAYSNVQFTCQRKGGECTDGWTRSGDMCYMYGYRKTWQEANHDCTSRGANLVVFSNSAVQTFVESTLVDFANNGQSQVWIGYSQQAAGTSTGAYAPVISMTGGVTNWAAGYPAMGTLPYGCGRIGTATLDGKWTSSTCADLNGYLCQSPAGRGLKAPTTIAMNPRRYCETGWVQWNEECYIVLKDEATFDTGDKLCKANYGASLAMLDGVEYQAMITRLVSSSETPAYWIGLKKIAAGDYKWVRTNKSPTFLNLADDANLNDPDRACAMMYGGTMPNAGRWDFRSCTDVALPLICSKESSLLTTIATPPTAVTGTPSTRCPSGWEEDAVLDYCYFYMRYTTTWTNALHGCRAMGAELAYVDTFDQMRIIANRIKDNGAGWWLGLNKIGSATGYYSYSDGKHPIAFTYWDNGQPNLDAGDCAIMLPKNGAWKFAPCGETKYDFICQRVADIKKATPKPPAQLTTPKGGSFVCKDDTWTQSSRNNYCYKIVQQMSTYYDASRYCGTEMTGGNLVSIADAYEQDLVLLMADKLLSESKGNVSVLWIGMTDQIDVNYPRAVQYVWSDKSSVTYTPWMPREPSSSDQECVAMRVAHRGEWFDMPCSTYQVDGFVCEAPPIVYSGPKTTTMPSGCQLPYTIAYEGKCFFINSQGSNTWDEAASLCRSMNGLLVVLSNRQEQSYLAVALASPDVLQSPYWIGLSGTNNNWKWVDGTTPTFTNWDSNYTSPTTRTCVAITDASSTAPGLWTLRDCGNSLPYVCQANRQGWTRVATTKATTVNPAQCPSGWLTEGYRCYLPVNQALSAGDANRFCETNYAAILATFTSLDEQTDVARNLSKFALQSAWIGLSKTDADRGWQWIDGSPILFEQWDADQPDNADTTKTCAFLTYDSRRNNGYWVSDTCSDTPRQFLCMRHKGSALTTTTGRPVDENATAICGGPNWSIYGDSCYYAEQSYQTTWSKALERCYNMSAHFVSIMSAEENLYVKSLITHPLIKSIWIGLSELGYNGYAWSDGSPLLYTDWDSNAHADNSPCISMTVSNGKWLNQHCETPYSFVCKKPTDGTVDKPTMAPPNSGGCPPGYVSYAKGSKCYQVITTNTYSQADALKQCQLNLGQAINLASFNDVAELNFVVSKMRNVNTSTSTAYIGLYDFSKITGQSQFRWLDNSPLYFTNWDYNEPDVTATTPPGSCVEMHLSHRSAGGWRVQKDCTHKRHAICTTTKSAAYPNTDTEQNTCKPSWVSYNEHCYYIDGRTDATALSWDSAREACIRMGAELVSIHDPHEQAAVTWAVLVAEGITTPMSFWIGLNTYAAAGIWQWTDGWPVDYVNWLPTEPAESTAKRCVAGGVRSAWASEAGGWASIDCRTKNAYVCRTTTGKPSISDQTYYEGTCPTGWVAGISHCYYVNALARVVWGDPVTLCRSMNATYSTFDTFSDNQLVAAELARQMSLNPVNATDVWIGVSTYHGLTAADNAVVSFQHWADGVHPGTADMGVYIKVTSYWYLAATTTKLGYVCKKAKTVKPTSSPDPTASPSYDFVTKGPAMYKYEETYDSGVGLIVGISIAFVVVLVGLVGLLLFLKRKNMVPDKIDEIVSKSGTLKGASSAPATSSSAGASSSGAGLVGFENVVFEAPKDSGAATVPKPEGGNDNDYATV